LNAGEIEGHILYETKQYADAQILFRSLLDVAKAANDPDSEARCHHNAGYCAIYLDDFKTANIHFSNAIALLTDLGQTVAASRTQWGAGQVLIAKGQTETGLKYVQNARDAFLQHGLAEEAGLCGLFIAETLLSRGDKQQAKVIVGDVARELRQSLVERRLVDAVAGLEDTIGESDAPVESVHNVYTLIESAHSQHGVRARLTDGAPS